MEMCNIKINGMPIQVEKGLTILEAAREAGVRIPTLCYLKEMNAIGSCRICVVEVKGARNLAASCVHPVSEGMEINTNTPQLLDSRRKTLQLILSEHNRECLTCPRSNNCELQTLCNELGVDDENYYEGFREQHEIDDTAEHMYRDNNKCILCRRCSAVCEKMQGVAVIGPNKRGFNTTIGSAFELGLGDTSCISCGQCIVACPTGALHEKSYIDDVLEAIADPDKYVIVQTAPSVRAGLGEEFGYPIGTDVEGKMAAALRRIGFNKVFDTDFAADVTIMEEATEFLHRVKEGGVLPLITSCSPGWVKYCEHYFPDLLPHVSSCKSPQQMFGALAKTYFAEKQGIDPAKIVSVSVMPCTAKKFEIGRDDQNAAGEGMQDVDISITTRELAALIRRCGLEFNMMPEETFDNPMGESTGAAVIFGATGGVMEAALRTAVETLTGEELASVDFNDVRGTKGIKEATFNVAGMDVNVAVVSGLENAKVVLERIRSGEANYHFIEVMACSGGCVNGGGQPVVPAHIRNFTDVRTLRAGVLYRNDANKPFRKSHDNPSVKKLYDEYLEKPGSHKAHHILHTSYVKRTIN